MLISLRTVHVCLFVSSHVRGCEASSKFHWCLRKSCCHWSVLSFMCTFNWSLSQLLFWICRLFCLWCKAECTSLCRPSLPYLKMELFFAHVFTATLIQLHTSHAVSVFKNTELTTLACMRCRCEGEKLSLFFCENLIERHTQLIWATRCWKEKQLVWS